MIQRAQAIDVHGNIVRRVVERPPKDAAYWGVQEHAQDEDNEPRPEQWDGCEIAEHQRGFIEERGEQYKRRCGYCVTERKPGGAWWYGLCAFA